MVPILEKFVMYRPITALGLAVSLGLAMGILLF